MPTIANATTIVDSTSAGLTDTGLGFVGKAGYMYRFKGSVVLTSAATTTGPALAIDTPATPTLFAVKAQAPIATATGTDAIEEAASVTDQGQMTFTTALSTQGTVVEFDGYLVPSVAGEVKVQFNTEVNGSAVTYKGGELVWREIGLAA